MSLPKDTFEKLSRDRKVLIARQECWLQGNLRYLTRKHAQRRLYDKARVLKEKDGNDKLTHIVWNCHRRLGKSFLLVLLAVERCLRYPNQHVKYGAPTFKQVQEIVVPHLADLLRNCPDIARPARAQYEWTFQNPRWPINSPPSILKIVGLNIQQGDRLRGQRANMAVLDEVREVEEADYILSNVLAYQFVGQENPLLICASTPPRTMSHDFVTKLIPRAIERGTYSEVPTSANEDWTQMDEDLIVEEVGDDSTTSYQREALCKLISEDSDLIIPEFTRPDRHGKDTSESVIEDRKRPDYFCPMVVMDTGWVDHTAILFGYVDFKDQILVVEDEIVVHYQTTGSIAASIRVKEHTLYKGNPHETRRKADCTKQQLDDLRRDHKLWFTEVQKYDRDQALARLRTAVQKKKVRIHPRCESLIYQLRHGVWNRRRSSFERSESLGHCDALSALVYMWRVSNFDENPEVFDGYSPSSHWGIGTRAPRRGNWDGVFGGTA